MVVDDVLAEAGIGKDHPDWGLEYNLCQAAIFGGLGIRSGQSEAVKDVLKRRQIATVDPVRAKEFTDCMDKLHRRLAGTISA